LPPIILQEISPVFADFMLFRNSLFFFVLKISSKDEIHEEVRSLSLLPRLPGLLAVITLPIELKLPELWL